MIRTLERVRRAIATRNCHHLCQTPPWEEELKKQAKRLDALSTDLEQAHARLDAQERMFKRMKEQASTYELKLARQDSEYGYDGRYLDSMLFGEPPQ